MIEESRCKNKMEFTGLFEVLQKILNAYVKVPDEVDLLVKFYESQEELYNARLQLTNDEIYKQVLIQKKDKYQNVDGCFIISPEGKRYTILLNKASGRNLIIGYDYIHELVHVCNNYEYICISGNSNNYEIYQNESFTFWDEFYARYISSIVLIEYLQERGEPLEKIKTLFGILHDSYRKNLDGNVKCYDGAQMIGGVCACQKTGLIESISELLNVEEIKVANELLKIKSSSEFL